jgi:hypothetical protein
MQTKTAVVSGREIIAKLIWRVVADPPNCCSNEVLIAVSEINPKRILTILVIASRQ